MQPLATPRLEGRVSEADCRDIVLPALIVAGLVLGALVGRWWVLAIAVAIGAYIGLTEEVEVSGWVLGVGYGVTAGLGIAIGILIRRGFRGPKRPPRSSPRP